MKSILFISDIVQLIGQNLENYEDLKALRHTCVSTFYLKYNVGIYDSQYFKKYINKIKAFKLNYNLVSLTNKVDDFYIYIKYRYKYIYTSVINIIVEDTNLNLTCYNFRFKNLKKITFILPFSANESFEMLNERGNYKYFDKFDFDFVDKEFEYYFKIHKIISSIVVNISKHNIDDYNLLDSIDDKVYGASMYYDYVYRYRLPLCIICFKSERYRFTKYILDIETLKPHPDSLIQNDISHIFKKIIKPLNIKPLTRDEKIKKILYDNKNYIFEKLDITYYFSNWSFKFDSYVNYNLFYMQNKNTFNHDYIMELKTFKPRPDSPNQIDISHLFKNI